MLECLNVRMLECWNLKTAVGAYFFSHRGTKAESLTFLTGLTGLTRLGNESLLSDEIILTQRGKGG